MRPGRYHGSLAVWLLLLAYASLYPFAPLRLPSAEAVAAVFAWPRYVMGSDLAINVIAYVPLGTFACLYLRGRYPPASAVRRASALALGMSAAFETLQLFIPNRVCSLLDVASNTLGGIVGALVFSPPLYEWVTRPLGELRERLVIPGAWGDGGLVLLMLWLLAQVNPALPFFGAGNIGTDVGPEMAALQWGAVGMGLCGFGLFVSTLLTDEAGSLRSTIVLMSVALWLKFTMASLVLQPHVEGEWIGAGRFAGLAAGLLAFVPLRRLPRPVRTYLALVLILAAALFAKIFGAYSALEELVRLFRWPHGQLSNFASLTRYLHEIWPFGAVVYLAGLFIAGRRKARDIIDRTPSP